MHPVWFIILSSLYIIALAVVDGLFNRLIFREVRTYPYQSKEKEDIYSLPEWRYIGLIFLVILPIILPLIASYLIGGWQYVLIYTTLLLVIQWDVIFGKLVFNNWWGDTPSIAIPYIGWFSMPLRLTIVSRCCFAAIIGILLSYT